MIQRKILPKREYLKLYLLTFAILERESLETDRKYGIRMLKLEKEVLQKSANVAGKSGFAYMVVKINVCAAVVAIG